MENIIIDVEDFINQEEYEMFINAEYPICTLTTTIDVTKLVKYSKRHKFNCLMCYCVQMAGQKHELMHYDFAGENKLIRYENVVSNYVMLTKAGKLRYISMPHCEDFSTYEKNYLEIGRECFEKSIHHPQPNNALVCTSAITNVYVESFCSGYTKDFIKPFLVWGKIERKGLRKILHISLRFHHGIFAGRDIGDFFNLLQNEINNFKIK